MVMGLKSSGLKNQRDLQTGRPDGRASGRYAGTLGRSPSSFFNFCGHRGGGPRAPAAAAAKLQMWGVGVRTPRRPRVRTSVENLPLRLVLLETGIEKTRLPREPILMQVYQKQLAFKGQGQKF